MTITITDPALLEQLRAAGPSIRFADSRGEEVAHVVRASVLERMVPCKTPEQLKASREQGNGRTLAEILADARQGAACTP